MTRDVLTEREQIARETPGATMAAMPGAPGSLTLHVRTHIRAGATVTLDPTPPTTPTTPTEPVCTI